MVLNRGIRFALGDKAQALQREREAAEQVMEQDALVVGSACFDCAQAHCCADKTHLIAGYNDCT